MKFYIASRLENAKAVKRLAAALRAAGHIQTYDWTSHLSVKNASADRLREVGNNEMRGVLDADVVIVILPGGRGTHTELGIALATGIKRIVLCTKDDSLFKSDENTTVFYWCDGVERCAGNETNWLAQILVLEWVVG